MGEGSLHDKWLKNLELKEVIREIADDLTNDCRMSEYGTYYDAAGSENIFRRRRQPSSGSGGRCAPCFVQRPWEEK